MTSTVFCWLELFRSNFWLTASRKGITFAYDDNMEIQYQTGTLAGRAALELPTFQQDARSNGSRRARPASTRTLRLPKCTHVLEDVAWYTLALSAAIAVALSLSI